VNDRLQESRGRVLLAEDDPVSQRVTRLMLEHLGFSVEVVANGADAVLAAVGGDHDVVLIDGQMPILDGAAAVAEIRSAERTLGRRVPIIAFSGSSLEDGRARFDAAGVDGHLFKPVSIEALEAAVDRLLRLTPDPQQPDRSDDRVVLDPAVIEPFRELARIGGPDTLRTMHSYLRRDTPQKLSTLRAAAAVRDPGAVAAIAHSIRGAMAFVGASDMVDVCRQIEELMVDRSFADLARLLTDVERGAALVEAELARIVDEP
jgi:CheY-like chemotaxis protein/HPt (histidine-containing phosphotransfer) domain-containing protein